MLITPLLVHLSGEKVRGLEWVACGLGLLGSILVALDSLMNGGGGGHGHGGAVDGAGNEVRGAGGCWRGAFVNFFLTPTGGAEGNGWMLAGRVSKAQRCICCLRCPGPPHMRSCACCAAPRCAGDDDAQVLGLVFVLISSMFFALSTVRLGRYSSMFDPLQLSTTSTCTLGLLSLTWVAASILGEPCSCCCFSCFSCCRCSAHRHRRAGHPVARRHARRCTDTA